MVQAIANIAYYPLIGNFSVVMVLGIIAYLGIFLTIMTQVINKRTKMTIPLKWHVRLAYFSLVLATIHALMIILSTL